MQMTQHATTRHAAVACATPHLPRRGCGRDGHAGSGSRTPCPPARRATWLQAPVSGGRVCMCDAGHTASCCIGLRHAACVAVARSGEVLQIPAPFSHSSSLRAWARSTCSRAMPSFRCISSMTCATAQPRASALHMRVPKHTPLLQLVGSILHAGQPAPAHHQSRLAPPCGGQRWSARCGLSPPAGPSVPAPRLVLSLQSPPAAPSRRWTAAPVTVTAAMSIISMTQRQELPAM